MTATPTRTKRAYDSSGRQAAAQRRRERVVEVATRLFAQHGWTGTTLALVAKEAGVSTELVSGAFGGKPGLLLTAVRSSTFGDGGDITGATAALHLEQVDDREERLDRAVEFVVRSLRTMAPLMPAMIHAAGEDAQALELIRDGRAQRAAMAHDLVTMLGEGPSDGSPDQQTVDLVYLTTSGEVYLQLTQELGWDEAHYTAWLRAELDRIIRG
ncbi:hypothetical protein GCM10011519_15170 [Marmoricola endophyticus]|uniref:HTH tetR-type domain-containing protein n=1 Tax=Marmoricola endophyticus TaxID=2040280 RepID=A0A917BFZ1_9ACTN|nr:TetR/AcrR family transcriptional regulator [Marmoricola endophyticus]GGF42278.1 hypothetical protein GCM10011519_15170 [Marmoricola endophyticus]